MTFRVIKASDWEFADHKSFYSVDEIYDYLKKVDKSGKMAAVLYFTGNKEDDQELWIYVSYIEWRGGSN